MSTAAKTRITADDYHAITVEGDRKQLVEGEIVVNEPKLIHATLQLRLAIALQSWIDAGPERGSFRCQATSASTTTTSTAPT